MHSLSLRLQGDCEAAAGAGPLVTLCLSGMQLRAIDEEASAVPVDHLVLLTLQAWCNHEGEENEPGAT